MNILFVSRNEFNPLKGGIECVTVTLAKVLKQRAHNVNFLCLARTEKSDSYIPECNTFFFPNTDIYSNDNINFYNNFLNEKKYGIYYVSDEVFYSKDAELGSNYDGKLYIK